MSKRTLTQLQGIGIPLLMSKSKQAAFHQVLWLCHQAILLQLEPEGKRSAFPASFVARDLQSSHPLTLLLPPSLGPVLSFFLLFLPFFLALAKLVSLFSLKTQLSSTALPLHRMNSGTKTPPTSQTICTHLNLFHFQGPSHIANAPKCLF